MEGNQCLAQSPDSSRVPNSPVTGVVAPAQEVASTSRAKMAELIAFQHPLSLQAGSLSSFTPLQSFERGLRFVIQSTFLVFLLLHSGSLIFLALWDKTFPVCSLDVLEQGSLWARTQLAAALQAHH